MAGMANTLHIYLLILSRYLIGINLCIKVIKNEDVTTRERSVYIIVGLMTYKI